jgi:hypothetical protein
VQRAWGCWFTLVQQKYLDDALAEDVLATAYQEMEHELTVLALDSDGVIASSPQRPPRTPLLEPTVDLAMVPVPCHPGARLKLEPGWSSEIRCHFCGSKAQKTQKVLGKVRVRRPES